MGLPVLPGASPYVASIFSWQCNIPVPRGPGASTCTWRPSRKGLRTMIGVIVVPGPSPRMHGLDTERPAPLLPLGDRPVLQHIIESLAAQGIPSIELIVSHAPERVEALLGNGDRWGCSFRYHLAAQPERPYRSLKIISQTKTEPWVLIH